MWYHSAGRKSSVHAWQCTTPQGTRNDKFLGQPRCQRHAMAWCFHRLKMKLLKRETWRYTEHLFKTLCKLLNELTSDYIRSLTLSMRRRLKMFMEAKSGNTKFWCSFFKCVKFCCSFFVKCKVGAYIKCNIF